MNQELGQTITARATFRDIAGDLVDPASVTLTILEPDGTEVTHNTVDLTNPSTGIYQIEITLDQPGVWRWRFVGVTDEGNAVCTDSICVNDSVLVSA